MRSVVSMSPRTVPAAWARPRRWPTSWRRSAAVAATVVRTSMPHAYQGVDEVGLRGGVGDDTAEDVEQRRSGVVGVAKGSGLVDKAPQALMDDGLEERLFGGEVTVEGARAHPCPARDVIQRHGQSLGCERLPRDL